MSETQNNLEEILIDIRDQQYLNKSIFNVEDLHKYTGLSKSKIYKLTRLNLIPTGSNKNIRQKFFKKEEIDRWLMGDPDLSEKYLEDQFNKQLYKNKKA